MYGRCQPPKPPQATPRSPTYRAPYNAASPLRRTCAGAILPKISPGRGTTALNVPGSLPGCASVGVGGQAEAATAGRFDHEHVAG